MTDTVKEIKDYKKANSNNEVQELRAEMAELRALIKSQASSTSAQASSTLKAAKNSITALAADVGSKTRTAMDEKRVQAHLLSEEGKAKIHRHPFESIGISLLTGMILSLLFFRR